jgi:enterochelin esterase-like enzyme
MTRNGRQCIRLAVAGLVVTGWIGCSSSDKGNNGPPGPQSDAATTGGSGGSLPTAGTGGAAATGGASGSGGNGSGGDAVGGSGGAVITSDAGDTSSGDSLPPSGSRGTQTDPGATGDGQSDLNAPYVLPPESLMHLNGAPTGAVSGLNAPQIYASKAVYAGLKFQYWIYVPAQYKPGQRAALAVVLDGHHYLGVQTSLAPFHAPVIFDNLIHAGDMPVTIGLFIDPGTSDGSFTSPADSGVRSMQYDTPSDKYSRFLIDEMIPDVILSKYDIVEDPDGWSIVGHSSGGICAFMVGWYKPDKFHKLLTHDASFPNTNGMFPRLVRDFATTKPLRISLVSSPLDLGRDANGGGQSSWFAGNNDAAQVLMTKMYHYRYRVGRGSMLPANPTADQIRLGDHYPPKLATADFPDTLRWMWRGYKLPWYP